MTAGREVSSAKIRDLQALRGLCISLVLVHHVSLTYTVLGTLPWLLSSPFYVGVEIFFVISGYVVTNSLLHDEMSAARFLVKRLFRLLPATVCFLLFTASINAAAGTLPLPEHMTALFTVPVTSFVRQAAGILCGYWTLLGEGSYYNGAIWSLSVEDQFYGALLAFCALVPLVGRCRPATTGRLLCGLSLVAYLAVTGARLGFLFGADLANAPRLIHYLLAFRFDFIAAGVVLAFVERRLRGRLLATFSKCGPVVACLTVVAILALLSLSGSEVGGIRRRLDGLAMPVVCLLISLLVALAANNLAFPATRRQFYAVMEKLGDRSYTYYLMHFPMFVVAWLLLYFAKPAVVSNAWLYGVFQIGLTAMLLVPWCELVHRCVELPATSFGRTLASRIGAPRRRAQALLDNALAQQSWELSIQDATGFRLRRDPRTDELPSPAGSPAVVSASALP
jgi:peptidoglycan/LPS O-acetylase OafA/YrhL